jgi:thioredoxin 1
MVEVTDQTFDKEVLESDIPVVVDLWAPWCGPCKSMGKVIDEMEKQRPELKFVKVNIDENYQTPSTYNVRSIPTLMTFKNGELIDLMSGFIGKKAVEQMLKSL